MPVIRNIWSDNWAPNLANIEIFGEYDLFKVDIHLGGLVQVNVPGTRWLHLLGSR